jgi:hypothetical protein
MSINNLVSSAINSKLTAGTVLGVGVNVYRNQATEGAALPYVVYSLQGGGPLSINPSDLRDEDYFIRAYAATAAAAGSLDAIISGQLHGSTITVSGYTNYDLNRTLDLELVENPPDGKPIFMCGGIYNIRLDA